MVSLFECSASIAEELGLMILGWTNQCRGKKEMKKEVVKTDCIDDFTVDFAFFNNNNNTNSNKCKDNKTNNGKDDNDQTHTQKTVNIFSCTLEYY